MRHLSDGTLRRIYDEPLALTAADQAHFDECAECKPRFHVIANDARATTGLLQVPAFEPPRAPHHEPAEVQRRDEPPSLTFAAR